MKIAPRCPPCRFAGYKNVDTYVGYKNVRTSASILLLSQMFFDCTLGVFREERPKVASNLPEIESYFLRQAIVAWCDGGGGADLGLLSHVFFEFLIPRFFRVAAAPRISHMIPSLEDNPERIRIEELKELKE